MVVIGAVNPWPWVAGNRHRGEYCVRKHPSRGWKVGDLCEVRSLFNGDRWRRAVIDSVTGEYILGHYIDVGATMRWARFSDESEWIRRPTGIAGDVRPRCDTLSSTDRVQRIITEMSGLKHGPGGRGGPGDCDPGCLKCALQEELNRARAEANPCSNPLDAVIDGVTLRTLIAQRRADSQEAGAPLFKHTDAQRSAVSAYDSARLRDLVAQGSSASADQWRPYNHRDSRHDPRIGYSEED